MRTIDMDDGDPPEDGKPKWANSPRRGPRGGGGGGKGVSPKALISGAVIALAVFLFVGLGATGNLGFVEVDDSEVAVKVNYVTGSREVITTPGVKLYIPFLQAVFKLDKTPQKYLMEGNVSRGDNSAPALTVRASDGSNFRFESLEIQYVILPGKASDILDDSGLKDGFKRDWMRAFARSVLRDEFGRYSAVEGADPSSYDSATVKSIERLNEYLMPHGLKVTRIITPKPTFDPKYEQAIEDRKVADQDVERLKGVEKQLIQERGEQLARVEKEKEIEWQELQGELVKNIKDSERESIFVRKGADRYKVTREAEGKAERDRSIAEAEGLTAKYTKEAEGIRARAGALEKKGAVVVREALIAKLANISFTLVPYSRDPSPKRLEHMNGDQKQREASIQAQGDDR
jgi:regulator of protease activity HflC (stomatin/prohibitin superfamily)